MGPDVEHYEDNTSEAPTRSVGVQRLVMRLRRYNDWRRGADFEQPEPTEIGRDIDKAADVLERNLMRWQPIETAPTDGSSVLVFLPGSKYVRNQITSGYWSDHQQCRCWIAGGYMQKDNPPTHWMPYPDGPDGCA